MNTIAKKAVCVLLILAVVMGFAACKKNESETTQPADETTKAAQPVFTDAPGKVVKAETVYVNLEQTGAVKSVTVSDWLHTDRANVRVTDQTDLSDIVNVKGTVDPVFEGENLIWNMDSTDLYYRGYSEKPLPVNFEIKYYLNGTETAPESISGTDGQLKIEIRANNAAVREVTVDGISQTVYEPMLVIGGMLLNEAQFSNVRITNGKTIGDGTREIAFFVGLPGMAENLGLTDRDLEDIRTKVLSGVDFSDTFTIEADIHNAQFGNMYFAALPLSSLRGSLQLDETLSGVEGMLSSVNEVVSAIYAVDPQKLIDTLTTNSDKLSTLTGLIGDAKTLLEQNRALIDTITKYATPENVEKLKTLVEDLRGLDVDQYVTLLNSDEVKALVNDVNNVDFAKYQALLANPLFSAFFKDVSALMSDAETLMPQLQRISADVDSGKFKKVIDDSEALLPTFNALKQELSTGDAAKAVEQLPQTLQTLSSLFTTLQENREVLDTLSSVFSEENLQKLTDALSSSDDVQLNALLETVAGLTSDPAGAALRLKAIAETAKENQIYSTAPAGMQTSVMYVYQTPGIAVE